MRIVIQLTSTATREARRAQSRDVHVEVLSWLEQPLDPMHPSTSDESLACFYVVDVDDPSEAARLVSQLNDDPAVAAAYIKPGDELP